mmetsp:Transcript_4345/g.5808  ORF Transcript_4345/g.5808 Transcript_4345/m.5808 type:complete len:102 (-) Transcript_4345:265-570(-)
MNILRMAICLMAFYALLCMASVSSAQTIAGELLHSTAEANSRSLSNNTEELKARLSELKHEFDVGTHKLKKLRHGHNTIRKDIRVSKMHLKNKFRLRSPTN